MQRPVRPGFFGSSSILASLPLPAQWRLLEDGFRLLRTDLLLPLLAGVAGLVAYLQTGVAIFLPWVVMVAITIVAGPFVADQFDTRPAPSVPYPWCRVYESATLIQAAVLGVGGALAAGSGNATCFLLLVGPLNFAAAIWGSRAVLAPTARAQMALAMLPLIIVSVAQLNFTCISIGVLAAAQLGVAMTLARPEAGRVAAEPLVGERAPHVPLTGNMALDPTAGDFQKLLGRCQITGLLNRHSFSHLLALDGERAYRAETQLSLLLLQCGEQVEVDSQLACLARRLQGALRRSSDAVASLGGGKFGVLLPFTDALGAAAVARNLQTALRAPVVEDEQLVLPEQMPINVGIATYCGKGLLPENQLLHFAEEALVGAKKQGGDKISRHDPMIATLRPAPYLGPMPAEAIPARATLGNQPAQQRRGERVVQLHQKDKTETPAGAENT
jgi:diguanylate cyclase (GGDEF)-like protein